VTWASIRKLVRFGGRYRHRLVAGTLAASVPITIALGVIMTTGAAQDLSRGAEATLLGEAQGTARLIDRWLSERQGDMEGAARHPRRVLDRSRQDRRRRRGA
jgi:hypothetical protein